MANKITEKILLDARNDAESILNTAREKAAANRLEAEAAGRRRLEQVQADARAECEEADRRAMLIAELDIRKESLAARRTVLDEAYAGAAQRLNALSGETWKKLITSLVVQGAETGRETLCVPRADRPRYDRAFLEELNAAVRSKKGLDAQLTLSGEDAPFASGVLLQGESGNANGSFEAVLREVRQNTEKEVADLLFGKEG